MSRQAGGLVPLVHLDPNSRKPLYRQLDDELRVAILGGRLSPGSRIPSSRSLAEDLGISRSTVLAAYDQLLAEGYLESREGSGTFVTARIPDYLPRFGRRRAPVPPFQRPPDASPSLEELSDRGLALARAADDFRCLPVPPRPFQPGLPSYRHFPYELWSRLGRRGTAGRRAPAYELRGHPALRTAIAEYLSTTRGVVCDADQVIVTTGAQQALAIAVQVFLAPGDHVWLEDPGYLSARHAFLAAGVQVDPIPVDEHGLDVEWALAEAPGARLAYVSPSHQFPLGPAMSLSRRLTLLKWAEENGAWVIEDDYDSEYRFRGRPLKALQGLDGTGRVIYLGTFSNACFPVARVGYLVAPPTLVDTLVAARIAMEGRILMEGQPPWEIQATLARFIQEGHLARYLRVLRSRLGESKNTLDEALTGRLGDILRVEPVDAGIHLVAWLPPTHDDRALSAALGEAGVRTFPLSGFYLGKRPRSGLIFGYGAFSPEEIIAAVDRLAEVVRRAPLETKSQE